MGTIISDPFPVEERIGNNAIIAQDAVIIAGRTLFSPATATASRIFCIDEGFRSAKTWWIYVPIITPSSVAIPNHPHRYTEVYGAHLE